jgi:hypothetical protein
VPGDKIYFGDLDSAVDDGGAKGFTQSVPLMMAVLLLDGRRPLLSQTQAFDNAQLLGTIGDCTTETSRALLGLVRADQVRAGFYAGALADEPGAVPRESLANAFCTALEGSFRFSAWPELEGPASPRAELAAVLRAGDWDWPQVESIVDGPLLARLYSLHELDRALRDSPETEVAEPLASGGTFEQSRAGLERLARQNARLAGEAGALIAAADARRKRDLEHGRSGYASRTIWRTMIEALAGKGDISPEVAQAASGIVDIAYHRTTAASLGTRVVHTSGGGLAVDAMPADSGPGGAGEQLVRWAPGDVEGLTWEMTRTVLLELADVVGPPRRHAVAHRLGELLVAERIEDEGVMRLRFKLQDQGATGIATVIGGLLPLVGLAVGGPAGAAAGAAAGTVVGRALHLAMDPLVRRAQDQLEEQWTRSVVTRLEGGA